MTIAVSTLQIVFFQGYSK